MLFRWVKGQILLLLALLLCSCVGDQMVNQCTLGNLSSRGRPLQEEGAEGADRLGQDSVVTTLVLVIASPQVAGSGGK